MAVKDVLLCSRLKKYSTLLKFIFTVNHESVGRVVSSVRIARGTSQKRLCPIVRKVYKEFTTDGAKLLSKIIKYAVALKL